MNPTECCEGEAVAICFFAPTKWSRQWKTTMAQPQPVRPQLWGLCDVGGYETSVVIPRTWLLLDVKPVKILTLLGCGVAVDC